jgi:glucose-1-phosphate adenylyltransferase
MLGGTADMYAYDFRPTRSPATGQGQQEPYWRDVGTIDAYWEANMDLRAVTPALNLYNRQWPLRTSSFPDPPAKFTFDDHGTARRSHRFHRFGRLHSFRRPRAQLRAGPRRAVHAGALVEDSVILDNCDIGRRLAKVRRAILDKNVRVPEDATIGYDRRRTACSTTSRKAASWWWRGPTACYHLKTDRTGAQNRAQ